MPTSPDEVTGGLVDALRAGSLAERPWAYVNLSGGIPMPIATSLADRFEEVPLTRCEQTEGGKTYRFGTADLSKETGELPRFWRSLVQATDDEAYRTAMSELTKLDLHPTRLTLSLWEYRSGDWLSPHLDKPEKLVTQVVYLTREWREGDGGRLLIMEGHEPTSVVEKAEPRVGNASVLVRSEASWHAVEQVAPGASPRRSLTLTFWKSASG